MPEGHRVPGRVVAFAKRLLGDLGTDCQRFLKVGAVLGRSFMLEDVSRMLDKSAASLLSPLDEAISSGFFVAVEHQPVFRSDFLLAGVIESIPAPARGALRREAMGHSGRRAEPEDRQFWMTGHPLWTADRPAGPLEGAAAGSGELHSKSYGLIMGGRATAGIRTADPVWRLHFRLALAGKLANLREFDTAESLIGEAEAGLRERGTRVWDAAPAAVRARLFLQAGRFGEARRQAELAIAAAGRDAVPVLRPLACSVLSTVYLYEGDLPAATEYLKRVQGESATDRAVLHSPQYAWTEVRIAVKREGPRAAVELFSDKYGHLPTQRRACTSRIRPPPSWSAWRWTWVTPTSRRTR